MFITFFSTQLVEVYGPQAEGHLLRCLFSAVDFSGDSKGSSKDPLVCKTPRDVFNVSGMLEGEKK